MLAFGAHLLSTAFSEHVLSVVPHTTLASHVSLASKTSTQACTLLIPVHCKLPWDTALSSACVSQPGVGWEDCCSSLHLGQDFSCMHFIRFSKGLLELTPLPYSVSVVLSGHITNQLPSPAQYRVCTGCLLCTGHVLGVYCIFGSREERCRPDPFTLL